MKKVNYFIRFVMSMELQRNTEKNIQNWVKVRCQGEKAYHSLWIRAYEGLQEFTRVAERVGGSREYEGLLPCMRLSETVLGSLKAQGGFRDCEVLRESFPKAHEPGSREHLTVSERVAESLRRFPRQYEGLLLCTRVSETARRSPIEREGKGARDPPSTYRTPVWDRFSENVPISPMAYEGFRKHTRVQTSVKLVWHSKENFHPCNCSFFVCALSVN